VSVATLDGVNFPYTPDSLQWSYKLRTAVQDTLGGRVVQLLGMQADTMTISGKAGSREKLEALAAEVVRIMKKHISTGDPVELVIPSRSLKFSVYVQTMPTIERNVKSTAYPYTLTLKVQHTETNVRSEVVLGAALSRLYKGIGYQTGWSGGGEVSELTDITSDQQLTDMLSNLLGVKVE
jgi:hypothetical protein